MAGKKKTDEEVIVVKLYGQDVPVPRGDTPQGEWDALKAKHQEAQRKFTAAPAPDADVWAEETGMDPELAPGRAAGAAKRGTMDTKAAISRSMERIKEAERQNDWSKVSKQDFINIRREDLIRVQQPESPDVARDRLRHEDRDLKDLEIQSDAGGARGLKGFVQRGLLGAAGGGGGQDWNQIDRTTSQVTGGRGGRDDQPPAQPWGEIDKTTSKVAPVGGKGGQDLDELIKTRDQIDAHIASITKGGAGGGSAAYESPTGGVSGRATAEEVPERRGVSVGRREQITEPPSGDLPPQRSGSLARDVGSAVGGTLRAAANPLGEIDRALGTSIDPAQFERNAGNMIGGTIDLAKSAGETLGQFGAGLMNPGSSAPAPMQGPVHRPDLLNGPPSAPPPGSSPAGPPPSVGSSGGSVSIGVKGTVPGTGGGPGALPEYPPKGLAQEQQAALAERANAQADAAEIVSRSKQRISEAEFELAKTQQEQEAEWLRRQEAQQARAEKVFSAYQKAQQVVNDPAKTPDPERYWKNHSKALFAIGVGLLAANKRDIGAILNSVDNAIKNDIEAQQAEFEAPRKAAKESMEASKQYYGMLRMDGLDAFEAFKGAQTLASQQIQTRIRAIADASDSELVKANARDAIARLQQEDQQRMVAVAQHAKAMGLQEEELKVKWYNAKTGRWEVGAKIAANASGGKNLTAEEKKRMEFSQHGREVIRRIKQLLGPEQSFTPALWDEIAKSVPGVQTKPKTKDQAVELLKTVLATDIAQSSLQAHEQKRLLESGLMSGVGLKNQSQAPLDELDRLFGDSIGRITGTGSPQETTPTFQTSPVR